MTEEKKFGTPPKTTREWLVDFIQSTKEYNATIPGIFFLHKCSQEGYLRGLETALDLLEKPEGSVLPYTLGPGESVEFQVQLEIARHD